MNRKFNGISLNMVLFLLLPCLITVASCEMPNVKVKAVKVSKDQVFNFPTDWLGKWKGTLVITKSTGDTTQLPMQLHILENDSIKGWDWMLIYGEKEGIRPYKLYEKDASKGHYIIDEKNSIVLDGYYFGDTFYSRFSVAGNLLLATYRKVGEEVWFEIISGSAAPFNNTGGKKEIPEVGSFGIKVQQRAVLRK